MNIYYTLALISEALAAVSATIFFFKYRKTNLKWILPLLWYILINELLSQFVFPQTKIGYLLYNGYSIIVPLMILYLIHSFTKGKKSRKLVKYLIFVSIICFIIESMQINLLDTFIDISFTLTSILIIIGLLTYFIQEMKENFVNQVNKNLFLWVCFGFLIFHIPFPVIAFVESNISKYSNEIILSFNKIHLVLASLSYCVIAFGFYWSDKIE